MSDVERSWQLVQFVIDASNDLRLEPPASSQDGASCEEL
ncbi:hypothetical protein PC128_g8251 [Phytophthora cactorum]|nr:hypothetical protein PC128_g8251 [Phytophthora cactorum]